MVPNQILNMGGIASTASNTVNNLGVLFDQVILQ